MNIQCDKCKKIYYAEYGSIITYNVLEFCQPKNSYLCLECTKLIKEVINKNLTFLIVEDREKAKRLLKYYGVNYKEYKSEEE